MRKEAPKRLIPCKSPQLHKAAVAQRSGFLYPLESFLPVIESRQTEQRYFYAQNRKEPIMNRFFHRTKRACALLMAVITLASFAVPASAFDDLSEVVNVTDYGTTEVPETPPRIFPKRQRRNPMPTFRIPSSRTRMPGRKKTLPAPLPIPQSLR